VEVLIGGGGEDRNIGIRVMELHRVYLRQARSRYEIKAMGTGYIIGLYVIST